MAKKNEPTPIETQKTDIEQIERRIDMLDQRLDNIDSMVSALVERVMKQPVSFSITCSKCGNRMEIAFIGNEKPKA